MNSTLAKVLEIISVMFFSGLKYMVGLVNATFLFNMGFIPSVLITIAGGMAGVFLFTLLDRMAVNYFRKIRGTRHRKIRFTKRKRWIVRIKKNYGLAGIAFLTPIVLQVPVGTILAMRLIKDVRKVSLAMLISFTFFSLIFCGLYYGFSDHFRESLLHFIRR